MNKIKQISGFTLVELIVSITILSIMMISVISIYISMSELSLKSDINRSMQENIKNVIEKISEDVRRDGITSLSDTVSIYPAISSISGNYGTGSAVQLGSNKYFLARKVTSGWARVVDYSLCDDITEQCNIYQEGKGILTNSSVSVERLEFHVSKDTVPKLTLLIDIRPASRRGLKSTLIENSKLRFQTSISERPLK